MSTRTAAVSRASARGCRGAASPSSRRTPRGAAKPRYQRICRGLCRLCRWPSSLLWNWPCGALCRRWTRRSI
eukprot:7893811-Lingulodinium_polyedra.AAC.1